MKGYKASDFVSIDGTFSVKYPFILANQTADLNTEANGVMGLGNWPGVLNLVDLAYDSGAISVSITIFTEFLIAFRTKCFLSILTI